jgi:chitodextrinase
MLGNPVTLTRAGTTNFTFGWTENVIWKPDSTPQVLGNMALGSMSYTPAAGTGTYSYQFRLVDTHGNYRDQWISFTVTDPVTPPSTVGATSVGSYSVALSWSGATAAAGINHYNVYRNGTLIGTASGTTYTDSTALPGTAYSYTIKTVDNGSGLSAASSAVSVTTAASLEIFTPLP